MRLITLAKKRINEDEKLYLLLKRFEPFVEVLILLFIWLQILNYFQLLPPGMTLFVNAVGIIFLCLNVFLRILSYGYANILFIRVFTFVVVAAAVTYIVSAHLFGIDGLLSVFAETNNVLGSIARVIADAPFRVRLLLTSFAFFAAVYFTISHGYISMLVVAKALKKEFEKD